MRRKDFRPVKYRETKNFVRERVQNPKKFKKSSFVTKVVSPKTEIILAKPKGSDKQEVQAILHKKPYNLNKSITKESKHMTKMRKKYAKHKFTHDELFGYD